MPNVIGFDTESYYSDDYSIKTLGTARYCRDPLFDVYMISVSDGASSWAGHPRSFNWNCLDGNTVLSHNAAHDRTVVAEMQKRGLAPEVKPENWYCTANMAACLCNRRDLERASEFLLGVRLVKDARAAAKGKHYADMERDGSAQKMLEYARGDALYCHQLFMQHGHRWSQFERDLSELTVRQAMRGVQIDTEKLQEYYQIVHTALARMEASLPWVKEGRKVMSPKAVAEECRRCKIPSPPIKSHEGGEADFAEWYKTYEPRFSWIRVFSDFRSISILLNNLEKIRERVDENGILNFGLYYFAALTGRWGGSGGINMLNLKKEKYFFRDDGLPLAEESELKEIEGHLKETGKLPEFVRHFIDFRSLFIARPGKQLIVSDLLQIEPRIGATLCGDTAMLEKMSAGRSPYQAYAETKLGWTGGDIKKEDKKYYAFLKSLILGLSYGTGWRKYIDIAEMAGVNVCESDPTEIQESDRDGNLILNQDGTPKMVSGYGSTSKRLVKEFREANPLMCGPDGLWRKLENGFRASIGGSFEMRLPSGRVMTYRDVKEEWKRIYIEEEKKWKNKRVLTAEISESGRVFRTSLWGSMFYNHLCQGTGREILGHDMLSLERAGVNVLWSCHDETINECEPDVTAEDISKEMERRPEWFSECPIACETAVVPHYTK